MQLGSYKKSMAQAQSSLQAMIKSIRNTKISKFLVITSSILFGFIVLLSIAVITIFYIYARNLPSMVKITDYTPSQGSRVFSSNGVWIGEYSKEGHRYPLTPKEIPDIVKKAFVAAEDSRFYQHKGVDLLSILRAAIADIKAASLIQGGSTITQQLIKLLALGPEKSLERKIKEAILAYRLETRLSKDEILTLYLNEINLGSWANGVEAASKLYFHKSSKDLTLAEASLLASMPKAPNIYNPYINPKLLKERQLYVLGRMIALGFAQKEEARRAYYTQITVYPKRSPYKDMVSYGVEMVRKNLFKQIGAEALLDGGYSIHTTFDTRFQKHAQKALLLSLIDISTKYNKKMQIRTPTVDKQKIWGLWLKKREDSPYFHYEKNNYYPGESVLAKMLKNNGREWKVRVDGKEIILFTDKWPKEITHAIRANHVRIPAKDHLFYLIAIEWKDHKTMLIPEIKPLLQGCLVCIEPSTGKLLAIQGGSSFGVTQFNRATQGLRQPGSAFKPVIYALAIDKGFYPFSQIEDSPISFPSSKPNETWEPQNYDNKFIGPITVREALVHSRNVPSVKLAWMFEVKNVVKYAHKMGIETKLPAVLSISLGSVSIHPIELIRVYATLANLGKKPTISYLTKIENSQGKIIADRKKSKFKQVLPADSAYIVVNMMQDVIRRGTGIRASKLGLPLAGKTGTTNDFRDAWFLGFMPNFLAGVWVGFDDFHSMGKRMTGSRVAIPVFIDFINYIRLDGLIRPKSFKKPQNITFVMTEDKLEPYKKDDSGLIISRSFISLPTRKQRLGNTETLKKAIW